MIQTGFFDSSLKAPGQSGADLHEAIRQRAEEIYARSGSVAGHDLENWIQAEQEILREAKAMPKRTAIVIEVGGVQYVGEYRAEFRKGYQPGEFICGEPIPVRFEGQKMFVELPNGRELETTIVKSIS